MMFSPAPEVEEIAKDLIDHYHPHLRGQRIDYLVLDRTPKRHGKEVWGYAQKITGLAAYLGRGTKLDVQTPFFVIVIAEPVWDRLEERQRRALVDHELSHCGVDADEQPVLLSHDVEEFAGVLQRHGLWSEGVQQFFDKAGQLPLFEAV